MLLGHKHTGFGVGRIVGLGGHVEPGETALQATVRVAHEEAGLELAPEDLTAAGLVRFRFPARRAWDQDVAVFTATQWSGDPMPSDELTPAWYPVDDIPFDEMWDDARYWMLPVLDGGHVDLTVTFGPDNSTVESAL